MTLTPTSDGPSSDIGYMASYVANHISPFSCANTFVNRALISTVSRHGNLKSEGPILQRLHGHVIPYIECLHRRRDAIRPRRQHAGYPSRYENPSTVSEARRIFRNPRVRNNASFSTLGLFMRLCRSLPHDDKNANASLSEIS